MNGHDLSLRSKLKNPINGEYKLKLVDCYFLGAMLAGKESEKDEDLSQAWEFSYRLNATSKHPERRDALTDQIEQVQIFLKRTDIALKKVEKISTGGGAPGYCFTICIKEKLNRKNLYRLCNEIAQSKNKNLKGALLIGAYDCKGYLDKKKKYIVLDYNNAQESDIFTKCLKAFGINDTNLNPERERKRKNSKPRRPQLRIKSNQFPIFVHEIGWTWEYKQIEARKYLPDNDTFPEQGQIAQLLLEECESNRQLKRVDDDQPLIDALNQDLSELDHSKADNKTDAPMTKISDYECKSSVRQQKRNSETVKSALVRCGLECEIRNDDGSKHETFLRKKDQTNYLEPHHLIPLKSRDKFEYEIDCPANVVMLCSKCHDEIHYGVNYDKLIRHLFELRRDRLQSAGLLEMTNGKVLTEEELIKMY